MAVGVTVGVVVAVVVAVGVTVGVVVAVDVTWSKMPWNVRRPNPPAPVTPRLALLQKSYSQAIFGTTGPFVPKVSEPNIGSIPSS